MTHPFVGQLRFARSEWRRALRGIPEANGFRRFEPMNSIGWIVGHMAWHEQRYWLTRLADETPEPIQRLTLRHILYPASRIREPPPDRCQRIRVLIRVLEFAQRAETGAI